MFLAKTTLRVPASPTGDFYALVRAFACARPLALRALYARTDGWPGVHTDKAMRASGALFSLGLF